MTTNDTPEPVRAIGGPVRDTGWTVSTDCPRPAIMALRGDHGPEVFGEEAGRIPAPAVETVTDRAAIRACDEPDERHDCGDGLCRQCSRDFGRTTPAPSSGAGLDLDALHETICDNFTGMAEVRQAADLLVAEVRRSRETVAALQAEVERLTSLWQGAGMAHFDAVQRAEAAEARADALAGLVTQARTLIVNCVDPAMVGVEVKRQMLAALDGGQR